MSNLETVRSIGVLKVDQPRQLEQALSVTKKPVIQECIGSSEDEFTAGSLSFDGKCYSSILLQRTLRDGNTWTAKVVNNDRLQSFISRVSERLLPFGPCNFQFRLDSFGVPLIFEINARF